MARPFNAVKTRVSMPMMGGEEGMTKTMTDTSQPLIHRLKVQETHSVGKETKQITQ
jgi:hypothetical protein